MRQMIRHCVGLLVILAVSLSGDVAHTDDQAGLGEGPKRSPDETVIIQAILDHAAACRDEVVSAEIHYRWHISTYRNPDNTPERVRTLLDESDLLGDPDSLQVLVDTLEPFPALTAPVWGLRDFIMLGDMRRDDTSRGGIQLVNGEHEMAYDQLNRQLDVSSRGGSYIHKTQIEDFRSFPPSQLTADRLRMTSHQHGLITLAIRPLDEGRRGEATPAASQVPASPTAEYTFDDATRVMSHSVRYHHGHVYEEIWQNALNEYPGGMILPSLRINTLYREGILKSLTVWLIDEAMFNEPIDEDRFVMTVPEDTVLVDNRLKETVVRKVKKPVDDVRSILVPVMAGNPPDAHQEGMDWRWILILNGVGLICLSVLLWRRGSLASNPVSRPPRGASGAL